MGFSGWLEFKEKTDNRNGILYNMVEVLKNKDSANRKYYQEDYLNIGCINKNVSEHMYIAVYQGMEYTICFEGEIYNWIKIKEKIERYDETIIINSQIQAILYSYILWSEQCLDILNGNFSFGIWDKHGKKLFISRDRLGIQPMYYCVNEGRYIFSTQIKGILEYPKVKATIDNDGIAQLFGIGPAKISGKCVFKDIFEILPGNYIIINENGYIQVKYWDLLSKKHLDDERTTIDNVKELLSNSINEQCDENVAVMLSGGLDSSIITAVAKEKIDDLNTYSVDYIDNDINFTTNDFQPDNDVKYVEIMSKKFNTNHHNVLIDSNKLFKGLYDSMKARDLPGMADIDVSLLEFCKTIGREHEVILSGEFADEIFGGYPWFYKPESLEANTFPWSISLDTRQKILNKRYDELDLIEYVDNEYAKAIKSVPICEHDTDEEILIKRLMYLNIHWFGATLIERAITIGQIAGTTIRMPFANHKLAEYVWNIPWRTKTMQDREKGLLRTAYQDILPYEVTFRKKSPYPKTCDPNYLNQLKKTLGEILNDSTSPILELVDKEKVLEILNNLDTVFERPWFGQLMRGPQFIAYLIQINMWLIEYNVIIE